MLARHRVRACRPIIGPSGPTTCFTRVQSWQPIANREFAHAIRPTAPCKPALDLYGAMPSWAQRCIWPQLGQGIEPRFTRCLLGQRPGRLSGYRRHCIIRRHDRRLAGIKLDLFRPFALGFDPDHRGRGDPRAIGESRRRRGIIPVDDQEQSSKRASDEYKVLGHKHSPSLLPIAKFGFDWCRRIAATRKRRPSLNEPQMESSFTTGRARDTLLVTGSPESFRSGRGFVRRAPPALNRGPSHRPVQTRSLAASPRSCFRLSH